MERDFLCPFCGSQENNWSALPMGTTITCRACYASGPPVLTDIKGETAAETMHMRRDEAYKLWSSRSTKPKPPKEGE